MPKLSTVFLFSLRKSFTTPRAALSPVIFISNRYVVFFLFMPTLTDGAEPKKANFGKMSGFGRK